MGKQFVFLLPQEQRQVMDCKFQCFSALKWASQHLTVSQGEICSGLVLTALHAIPESSQTSMQLLQWRCICSHLQECHRALGFTELSLVIAHGSDSSGMRLSNHSGVQWKQLHSSISEMGREQGCWNSTGCTRIERENLPPHLTCPAVPNCEPSQTASTEAKMKVMSSSGQGHFFGQICTLHPLQDCTVQPHSKNKTPEHQYSSK